MNTAREEMEIIKLNIEIMREHKRKAEEAEEKILELERQIILWKHERHQYLAVEKRAHSNVLNDIADLPREERSKWMEMLK